MKNEGGNSFFEGKRGAHVSVFSKQMFIEIQRILCEIPVGFRVAPQLFIGKPPLSCSSMDWEAMRVH